MSEMANRLRARKAKAEAEMNTHSNVRASQLVLHQPRHYLRVMTQQNATVWGVWTRGGVCDPQIQTRARFLYNASSHQVSSSKGLFVSYRVDKQAHKQTDAAENTHLASLCYAGG